MGEPAVGSCAVPVLDLCGNVDHGAGRHLDGFHAPLLIVASSADADQHLAARFFGVMDVPVVAAARLKSHVEDRNLLCGNRSQITFSGEELSVRIGLADREKYSILVLLFICQCRCFLIPDFLGQSEYRPAFGPADIHGRMCDDGRDLFLRNAVRLRVLQMIVQGGIRDAGRHQRYDGDDAFCFHVDRFFVPNFSEKHIVIEMREHGSKFA